MRWPNALLQEVREHGQWETWLEFFLTGVRDVARQAHEAARSISAIYAEDAALIAGLGRGAPARPHVERHGPRDEEAGRAAQNIAYGVGAIGGEMHDVAAIREAGE